MCIPVNPERLRREVSHQICEDELERALDVLVSYLGVGLLTFFPHGASVVQTLLVEVPHPPRPEGGCSRRLHCELQRTAPTDKVQRKEVQVVLKLLERKPEVISLQLLVVLVEDGHDAVERRLLNQQEVPL